MNLNDTKFKFSFVDYKPKTKPKTNSNKKKLTPLITCIARRDGDKWIAEIENNLPNISNKTFLFTEQSFDLRGKEVVFSLEKDEHNHYIQYWRSPFEAMVAPHTSTKICTLCDKHRFSGHIVKDEDGLKFDMKEFIQ